MTGILVKDGTGTVIEKQVYGGDVSIVPDQVAKMKLENPSYTFTVVSDDEKAWDLSFESVKVIPKLTQEQMDWLTAKKDQTFAFSFLAKKLGLE